MHHDEGFRMRVVERDASAVAADAEIIERSWLEPEQFAVLFDRHAPLIHRYVVRRIGREAADDLVAETFLAAFGKRRRYDPSYSDARPWLYGIATNLVGQHRREENRQYRIRHAAIAELDVPGHAERVTADVTARAMRSQLTAALAGLPDAERDVLVLIAWEQLTYDEAARALEIPVGTVRSRLSRARARLRGVLAATGPAEAIKEILSNE
jgi:RNA polymerase sigma factor (sigma-70 family)